MADRSGESLSSSLAAEFTSISGDQTQREHWYDRPHAELVAGVKSAVDSARADYEANKQNFDPVRWVGDQLTSTIWRAPENATFQNRLDTSLVWDAISLPYIQDGEYRQHVATVLLSGTALRRNNMIKLTPEAGKLISVMADAVGFPTILNVQLLTYFQPRGKERCSEQYIQE